MVLNSPASRLRASTVMSRWPYFVLIGLAFNVYFRALYFDYTWLDDNVLILDNNWFLRNLANAGQAFTREVFNIHAMSSYYRPLLTLSFMLDAQFSGAAPYPYVYHLTNLLLHMTASCLVFAFLKTFSVRYSLAFFLSLLFTVHPVLSQAIAWIPGRNDSLLAIFALSAMLTLWRFWENGKLRYLVVHGFLFACGLFTKESMVFFPIIGTLWIAMAISCSRGAGNTAPPRQPLAKQLLKTVDVIAVWCVPLIVWYVLRKTALPNPVHYAPADSIKSLWHNAPALPLAIGKIFFPVNLSVMPILRDSSIVYGIAASVMVIMLCCSTVIRSKAPGPQTPDGAGNLFLPPLPTFIFGLSWFLIFLVPSFIRLNPDYTADFLEHRMYVPMAGLLLIVARIELVKNLDFRKISSWIVAGSCVFILSLITKQHLEVFSNPLAFYGNAVKHSPHYAFARKGLGTIYYLDGKSEPAEKELLAALALNPQEAMAHNCLGLIYQSRGDYLKAQDEFKKELALKPNSDLALSNWGNLCYAAGNKKDAETLWLKAIDANPDFIEAIKKLCSYYRETGDTAKERRFVNELGKRGITQ